MVCDLAPAVPGDRCDRGGPTLPAGLDLATGGLVRTETDLRVAGRGMDFVWTRTYRSRPAPGAPHWDHCYRLWAERTRLGVRVGHGDGTVHTYLRRADGRYAARGVFAEGRLDAAEVFRLRFAGGGRWEFRPLTGGPAGGLIARIVDRNDNALRFAYDECGRLEVVTDTLGRDVRVTHDRHGRIDSVTDFTGRRVGYAHTVGGDLAAVHHPAVTGTPTGNDFPGGAQTRYTYAGGHQLTGVTDRTGAPLLAVDYAVALGAARVITLRRGGDAATHVSYAAHGGDGSSVLALVGDPAGDLRDYVFDRSGACVRVREHSTRTETRYGYDPADGLPVRVERPDGSVVERDYEGILWPDAPPAERGNLRAVRTRPAGGGPELVRTFDQLPGFGCGCGHAFATRETDPRGATVRTEYDERGNPVLVSRPDGSRTRFTVNAFGDVTSRTEERDGVCRRDVFAYSDLHGQIVWETLDADGLAETSTFRHDDLGRPFVLRDATGNEHEHLWNAWDLLVRRILPDGQSTEDYRYDANGRLVELTVLAAGRETREILTYDGAGRPRTVTRDDGSGRIVVTTYSYDGDGNRVAAREALAGAGEPAGGMEGVVWGRTAGWDGTGPSVGIWGLDGRSGAHVTRTR